MPSEDQSVILSETSTNEAITSTSLLFKIQYVTSPGDFLTLCGSSEALGKWDVSRGKKMKWNQDHWWTLQITVPSSSEFEYKYVATLAGRPAVTRWEQGYNRKIVAGGLREIAVSDVWESVRVRFSIYYPVPARHVLCITGDPPEIGKWFDPGPTKMHLGAERRLQTGERGCCWELDVVLQRAKWVSFQYRYLVNNEESGNSIWEREPNRRLDLELANPVNGMYDTNDVNFVAGMAFDAVPPDMFIGPYPQCTDDIDAMKAAGVTAVLNVQTDEDVQHRQIPMPALIAHYEKVGIHLCRHPIRDFCPEDLAAELKSAVKELDAMIQKGLKVYIHCTAGMGRAPACAVAYLCWVKGMTPDAANAFVREHRKVAVPNMSVIAPLVTSTKYP